MQLNLQEKPLHIVVCLFASIIFWAGVATATDRFVSTTGSDVGDCTLPCLTLQYAVNQSSSGDVIHIAAGTYSVAGLVAINKTLTLLGAQAGVDARTRSGAESILSNTQGISVSASDVVFDGLTIQDSSNPAFTGYGIWVNPGVSGTQVINNIFQDNIVGLGISNGAGNQALVQYNLFRHNNLLPGGAGGTGIYTDQFVSGAVSNVLITENLFTNNLNAGIGFSNTDTTQPDSNITISNNVLDSNGRGIYFFNTLSSMVINNTITNLTVPTDGGSSTGIGIFGAVSDLSISQNDIEAGAKYGIRIGNFIPGAPPPPNTNIFIHKNNIFGFAVAGLHVDNAPVGPIDYATCNWWGSISGPTNPTLNPGGGGDVVEGSLVAQNFNPWLLGLAPDSPCGSALSLAKAFSPSTIRSGEKSVLTITLNNPSDTDAHLSAPLVDTLPIGVAVNGASSNTCGGAVTAINASSTVTLSGGTIPHNGSCQIQVEVTSPHKGVYTNTLGIGALKTDVGSNADPASAILTVLCKSPGC